MSRPHVTMTGRPPLPRPFWNRSVEIYDGDHERTRREMYLGLEQLRGPHVADALMDISRQRAGPTSQRSAISIPSSNGWIAGSMASSSVST